jgi:hypothetical protein
MFDVAKVVAFMRILLPIFAQFLPISQILAIFTPIRYPFKQESPTPPSPKPAKGSRRNETIFNLQQKKSYLCKTRLETSTQMSGQSLNLQYVYRLFYKSMKKVITLFKEPNGTTELS